MTLKHFGEKFKKDPCDVINSTVMVCPSPSMKFWDDLRRYYAYIGFILDGVTRYENLSQALPEQDIVVVYHDPTFDKFPEVVIDFKVYESNPIVIKVTD